MIPKQLFFIWLGNTPPDYCNFAINAFRDVNPDFKVDFLYWSIEDIENPKDEILKKSVEDVIKLNKKGKKFIIEVADLYRYKLLYKYGGIYLDCDTFPVRPFDDELLKLNNFAQSVICFKRKDFKPKNLHEDTFVGYDDGFIKDPSNYHCYTYQDIYFVGSIKEYSTKDIYFTEGVNCSNSLNPPWLRNLELSKTFLEYKDRFYKKEDLCVYRDFIFYTHYLMHFCSKGWQKPYKESPMYCELDDYLYGDK